MNEIRWTSRPVIGFLLAAGAALVAAFDTVPAFLLRGDYGAFRQQAALREAVGRGLVEYWRDGGPAFPALLSRLVDYWFWWHAIKVVISSLMLVVFVLLATALWRRYLSGVAGRAVAAVGASGVAVLATGLLILNIQVTAVPVVALLPLAGGPSSGELGQTLREMHQGLTEPGGSHANSPALSVLLREAERYQWVMVAVAGTVLTATALAGWSLWRRRRTGPARLRFMRKALGVILALTASLLLLMVAAGTYSAIEPTGTLLAALGVS